MMEEKDPRRKARTIMTSDSEWARFGERARALDMPISRFIVQQVLGATTAPPFRNTGTTPDDDTMTTPGLPPGLP